MIKENFLKKLNMMRWPGITICALTAFCIECLLSSFFTSTVHPIIRVSLLFLCFYIIHYFALLSNRAYGKKLKDALFLYFVLIISVVIWCVIRVVINALMTYFSDESYASFFSEEMLLFITPFSMGTLLVQAVLGMSFCFVLAMDMAIVVAFYFPNEAIFIPFVLISSLVASLSLRCFRSRGDYIRSGIYLAIVAIPFAISGLAKYEMLDFLHLPFAVLAAMVGGLACCFLAAGITPIVEHLCGYVTDMRLIEMATLDHPLLKELSLTAPGTWNHSMVIGMMVEAAAEAIGANPILARVGAYFHDIGKSKKPLYFVENQAGGENRHDKLSTSMSALIIKSHVKDGVDLARKYKVPEPVIDMIAQHHGTSLIEYFYEKANKEAQEVGAESSVDKSQFTYAGPKPQTKEAAILMLADGVEAASRTISEPTPDRIQGLVQKMINKVFASGELSECELTLQDLHQIAKTFNRILNGIYHQRIAYSEPAEKVAEKNQAKATENVEENGAKKDEKKEEKKAKPTEDLKRLGIE